MSFVPSADSTIVSRILKRVAVPADYRAVWRVRNLRLLALSRFCGNMLFYSSVIVAFERSRGLTFTQIFLLESILSASSWLLDIPTGVWAELIGYRRLLLLSRVFDLASLVVAFFAYGFWPFAFGSVLFGAHLACASGCEDALVYASLPASPDKPAQVDSRGSVAPGDTAHLGAAAFGLLGVANSAGFFVGLATGSFIGARNPTLAVIATLVPLTLALTVTFGLWSSPPTPGSHMQEQRVVPITMVEPTLTPAQEPLAPRPTARELLVGAWRLARTQPALLGLSLGQSAAFVLVNAIFWYNQPLFAHVGIAVFWYGPLTALAVGAAALVPLALPLAIRRIGRRWALAGALLAPGLAYLGLGLLGASRVGHTSPWGWLASALAVGLVALVAGGSAWRDPLIDDELARRSPARGRAATLSVFSFVGTLAGIALTPLIGRLGDVGLGAVGLTLGSILVALSGAVPWLLERTPAPQLTSPVMET